MQKRSLIAAGMVLGLAAQLSAQSPFIQPLSALERLMTGIEVVIVCVVIIVAFALKGAVGGSWRGFGNAVGGVTIALFVRAIMAWLWHV